METKHITKMEWKEAKTPFVNAPVDAEMLGQDLRIKRFMIYEDKVIKVTRNEDPTYSNEYNNYVQLLIKNGAYLIDFPIGGYINRQDAINNAKQVAESYYIDNETGLTPRQLLEQRDELLMALLETREFIGNNTHVLNNSDKSTGDIWFKINNLLNKKLIKK